MTMQELVTCIKAGTDGFKLGRCPICGGSAQITMGTGDEPYATISCASEHDATDGLGIECGAMLSAVCSTMALIRQLARWNKGGQR